MLGDEIKGKPWTSPLAPQAVGECGPDRFNALRGRMIKWFSFIICAFLITGMTGVLGASQIGMAIPEREACLLLPGDRDRSGGPASFTEEPLGGHSEPGARAQIGEMPVFQVVNDDTPLNPWSGMPASGHPTPGWETSYDEGYAPPARPANPGRLQAVLGVHRGGATAQTALPAPRAEPATLLLMGAWLLTIGVSLKKKNPPRTAPRKGATRPATPHLRPVAGGMASARRATWSAFFPHIPPGASPPHRKSAASRHVKGARLKAGGIG